MLNKYTYHQISSVIKDVRSFFSDQQYVEIIPPVFTETIPLEPNIYPFTSSWDIQTPGKTFFLSTSPERSLKIALSKGIHPCFAIGHCFRNLEGSGPIHSPEFLMLEWYRANATYIDIMEDVQSLVCSLWDTPKFKKDIPWQKISLDTLFERYLHISLYDLVQEGRIEKEATKHGYSTHHASWSLLFDQLFLNEIAHHLPQDPYFLIDFPSRISPLCTPKKDALHLAERFELFIQGIEIGNGNTESTDTNLIREIFVQQHQDRITKGLPAPEVDEEFLQALKSMQGTSYAGMGLGVERLTQMIFHSNDTLQATRYHVIPSDQRESRNLS